MLECNEHDRRSQQGKNAKHHSRLSHGGEYGIQRRAPYARGTV